MNLLSKFKNASAPVKGAVIGAALALPIAAGVVAWGPANRPTFTVDFPATYVTFNSITDNPTEGDERNFTKINGQDVATVSNNQEVTIRSYVHNNAGSTYNNYPAMDGLGIAKNVRFAVDMPNAGTETVSKSVKTTISADNSNPTSVFDEVALQAADPFTLELVPGSASYTNTAGTFPIPDAVVGTGAQLGYTTMDGKFPGCLHYAGVVTFKVRVKMVTPPVITYTLNKTVSKDGTNFAENVNVASGSTVTYNVEVKSTGTSPVNNVVLKDVLPAGTTYVAGTTKVNGNAFADGIASANGIDLGNKTNGTTTNVQFQAKLEDKCGVNNYVNTVTATTSNAGSKTDTASVTASKDCGTVVSCSGLDANLSEMLVGATATLTATGSVQYGQITSYAFTVKDKDGKVVATQDKNDRVFNFTTNTAGTYTVSVVVKAGDKSSTETCAKTIVVKEKPVVVTPVYTCDATPTIAFVGGAKNVVVISLDSAKIVAKDGAKVTRLTFSYGDGSTDFVTTNFQSENHTYAKDGKYTAKVTVEFDVNGEKKTVVCPTAVVNITSTVLGTSTQVTVIPNTGAGDMMGAFVGTTAVAYAAYATVASRKKN